MDDKALAQYRRAIRALYKAIDLHRDCLIDPAKDQTYRRLQTMADDIAATIDPFNRVPAAQERKA